MTRYDQWQDWAPAIEAALVQHRGHASASAVAHFLYNLDMEGRSLAWVLWDIAGRQGPEPTAETPPAPPSSGPVPPASIDLSKWPRRGATIAQSLLDTRWDYAQWANILGGRFGRRALTQVNILSAEWPETSPHFERPFVQLPDGRFDLHAKNQPFYDRLARYVEAMNLHGVVVQLCFLELYSWSKRKTGLPFDQNRSPFRHNVNGVRWGGPTQAEDDATLGALPDAFVLELLDRVVSVVKGAGVAFIPGNEFPEKPVHEKIARHIKALWPDARIITNRNDDTPGQYQNMKVGKGEIDMIAFHGWKSPAFLAKDFSPDAAELKKDPKGAAARPWTFAEFFANRFHNKKPAGVNLSRIIASSDGSRSSDDPVNTYDWTELAKVFAFVADKGGSIEHQSRAKMTPGARLDMVEFDFLEHMAEL